MARIPLADIPNAPQAAPMPQGDAHSVNFSTAASLLHQDGLAQGAFDGPAKGAQALGEGIANAGQGIGAGIYGLAKHKQKADDDTAVINASAALEKAHADYQASLAPGSDTNTWAPGLLKTLSDTAKPILADPSLSPDAKREIQNRLTSYSAQSYSGMQVSAAKESFSRSTAAHMNTAKQQLEAGDIEGAKKTYDLMTEKQLIFPEVADGLKYGATRSYEYNQASQSIGNDPKAAMEKLLDTKNFPTLSQSQRDTLTTDAQTQINARKKQALDFVTQGIETGKIADAQHALDIGNGYFDDTDKLKIEGMLNKATGPSYTTAFDLQSRIAAYDPQKDTDGKVGYDLYRDIKTTVPSGWQEPLLSKFEAKQKPEKPEASILASMVSRLDGVIDGGFLGRFDKKKILAGDPVELAKQEDATKIGLQIHKEAEDWLKANPKASYPEANDWMNKRLRDELLKHEQPAPTHWYNPFSWGTKTGPGPGPTPAQTPGPGNKTQQAIDEALKKYRGGSTGDGGAAGKVTSYGYGGDTTPDKNSAMGKGAWENKLHRDSLAVSPDVEANFAAAGIKPNDWIDLTLADGSTVRKQFADRTANDQTAKKLGLNPLRGRFDFYSPGGTHPKDGIKVVSFKKANA